MYHFNGAQMWTMIFEFHRFLRLERLLPSASVTRWPDCIFNSGPFTTLKICPKVYKLCQSELKFCLNPNNPLMFCLIFKCLQKRWNFAKSGHTAICDCGDRKLSLSQRLWMPKGTFFLQKYWMSCSQINRARASSFCNHSFLSSMHIYHSFLRKILSPFILLQFLREIFYPSFSSSTWRCPHLMVWIPGGNLI